MTLWGVGNNDSKTQTIEKSPLRQISNNQQKLIHKLADEPTIATNNIAEETNIKIKTGRHRPNVLHYYEANFATPNFYVYFMEGNKLFITPEDKYIEDESDCRLALAVKEKEKDGFLILSYSDGHIVKIQMDSIASLPPNERNIHRNEFALEHANIAWG